MQAYRRQAVTLDPGVEAGKVEMAVRQLERAELYLASAIELDLADTGQRRLLEGLLADLVAARRSLNRPRVAAT
jgi:hypothetical protein